MCRGTSGSSCTGLGQLKVMFTVMSCTVRYQNERSHPPPLVKFELCPLSISVLVGKVCQLKVLYILAWNGIIILHCFTDCVNYQSFVVFCLLLVLRSSVF